MSDLSTEFAERDRIELTITCRFCGAADGVRCIDAEGKERSSHKRRIDDARRVYEWSKTTTGSGR
jgi:hypothetical protein